MSERLVNASTAQSEIDAFTAAKKAEAKQLLLEDIFADSVTGHSELDEKRVQEGAEYYKHLEELSNRSEDYDAYDNEATHTAFDREWDDAIEENEAFDAAQAAFEAKMQADPKIRQMSIIADSIVALRAKLVTLETADADAQRIDDLEDRLTVLLTNYSERDDYDAAIESAIIDKTAAEGQSIESKPVAQTSAEAAAPIVSPAERTDVPTAAGKEKEEPSNTDDSDENLEPTSYPVEEAVREGESLEEYQDRIAVSQEPVPLMGDSLKIDEPVELTPSASEENQASAEQVESQDTPKTEEQQESAAEQEPVSTEEFTWKDAVRNPGGYLAIKMGDWRRASEGRRLANLDVTDDHVEKRFRTDKNLKILFGAVAGVAIVYFGHKLGTDFINSFGDHSTAVDIANQTVGNADGGNLVAPSLPSIEGSGQDWGGGSEYSEAAQTATAGEGWYQQLTDMGIPSNEQPAMLQKILDSSDPELRSWVYTMSDGNPGIARTDTFSDGVLKSIQKLR